MGNVIRWLLPLLIVLWSAPPVAAQGLPRVKPKEAGLSAERLARIDAVMKQHVTEKKIAGAVTLVARRGKLVQTGAYGMMDAEAGKPMRADTMFRIASMTKPITSVAVMMLYEEGGFLLSDPVSKYIPEFKKMKVLPPDGPEGAPPVPAKRQITIRNLLTHTSGLTYQWNKRLGPLYNKAGVTHGLIQDPGTIGKKMKILASLPLLFQPGGGWEYGLSVDVLGDLVEVVSGMTLDDFFRKRIFEPLSMKDTCFYLPPDKVSRLAAVYGRTALGPIQRVGEGPVKEDLLVYTVDYPYKGPRSYFSGGGGLVSTAPDYLRFAQMMLNGGELDGVRLLSPLTVELMTMDHVGKIAPDMPAGFGLGFGVDSNERGLWELTSDGTYGWGGFFYTLCFINPREKLIGISMEQLHPAGGLKLNEKFKILAHQAVVQ